jgi:hypothetical protein
MWVHDEGLDAPADGSLDSTGINETIYKLKQ